MTEAVVEAIKTAIDQTQEGLEFKQKAAKTSENRETREYKGLKSLEGSGIGDHLISCEAKMWTPPKFEGMPDDIELMCAVIKIANVFSSERSKIIRRQINKLPVIKDNGSTPKKMRENFRAHRSSSRNPGGVSQVTRKTLYATVAVVENTVESLLLDFVAEIMAIE